MKLYDFEKQKALLKAYVEEMNYELDEKEIDIYETVDYTMMTASAYDSYEWKHTLQIKNERGSISLGDSLQLNNEAVKDFASWKEVEL